MLAYAELTAFLRMAEDAALLAPTLTDRAALGDVAAVEYGHFRMLRDRLAALGVDPEEAMSPFVDAIDAWHAQTKPKDWYEARAEWCRFVRKIIELNLDGLDTAFQVANAVSAGRLKPLTNSRGVDVYTAWKAIEPTYQPEVYPVWLSDHALQAAIAWGYNSARRGGIVWTEHVPFGEKLSELTGWPYFRELGRDQKRRFIESELVQSNEVVIASIDSNGEGRNLQHKWNKNLIVSPMSSGADWEQVVSRTHREGQTKDVTVDYFVACYENYQSMLDAVERCRVAAETTSQSYRLLGCEFVPPTLVGRSGKYTWQRNSKRERVVVE